MTTQHPDEKFLQLYVAARLDEGKEKIIETHLARCPQCTKRVSELEQLLQNHDPLMQKFKELAVSDDDDSSEMSLPGTRLSQVSQSVSNVAVSGIIVPGDILGGNLRLEEKLGRGGMGETWKAFDQTAERFIVLKFVPGEMQHLKEAMESVRSSFQKIHALQHQHICPVYNLVDDPKHGLYIVMKYIDGLTLSEYRRRLSDKNKKMSFNDIVQILWAVAKGLDYAHERKVIHRDIKPGNIMIGRKDGVQIIDFGLAEEIRTLLSQTSDAEVMSSSGTRPYMAPEQWQGRVQDARTDQYALAVTAYELFAGHVPFSGNDVELLKNTVLNDSPESIASLPEYANTALLKGLSKKRDERYDNCKAFVKALVTKSESPDFVEVEERKFPDGAVTINDLPSDKGSGENIAPIWLPDGLSCSSSPSKPPIIAISTSSSKKNGLPSWVMPTISALGMLVVCMACFLGYTMMDKGSKPEKPDVVAKKPELKEEPIADPEPFSVQEENTKPEKDSEEEPQPTPPAFQSEFKDIFEAANKGTVQNIEHFLKNGVDVNARKNDGGTPLCSAAQANPNKETVAYLVSSGADVNMKDDNGKTPLDLARTEEKKAILREAGGKSGAKKVDRKTQEKPNVAAVAPKPVVASEPVEAVELRRQFEEAVEQAQTPYREELEKELALAKKKDETKLVSTLEAEQKHLDSEDVMELTAFTPEKRALFNAKVRFKKKIETARDNYLKEMDSLAKELARDVRTNDALFVQNEVDRIRSRLSERNHLGEQKLSLTRPKRSQFDPVPVIRMTMELHANGKGRLGVSRGMSTDSPEPLFPSQAFPLSAFPRAQAFRGQNGMGRVIWDFRNADPKATWDASGWGCSFSQTEIDSSRLTLRFESSKLEASQPGPRASFLPGKLSDFPVRLTVDAKVNSKGCCPFIYFCMNEKSGEQTYVDMWKPTGASPTDKLVFGAYTRKKPDGSRFKIALPNTELVGNQPVWSLFELPKAAVENVVSVQYMVQAGHERYDLPPRLDLDVEVLMIDISGKLKATTGFAVANANEKLRIENVSPRTSAFRAGLKIGDEIVRFNGEKRTAEQIQKMLKEVQFGDLVTIAVLRDGEEKVFRFHAE